jgi:hypothetical protein
MTARIRHPRHTVLAALAVALCASPITVAHASHEHASHAVVVPAYGNLLGEVWAQLYSLPVDENPFAGNGDPCLKVGQRVVQAIGGGPCTIQQGTALTLGFGTAWSNVEDPFPKDEAAQRALALAADQAIVEAHVTADDGDRVDIRTPRFEIFSPQRTVQLPEDNILGVAAQTVTLTAHAWAAVVRDLAPGRHTIVGEALLADGSTFTVPHIITVVPAS